MLDLNAVDRRRLSVAGIVVAVVLFVAINVFSSIVLQRARLDLTEGGLYTLSEGTRRVLGAIDEPITLRFYFSRSLSDEIPAFGNYAKRIRELLEHYVSLSGGMLRLKPYNPEPYSVEEDEAVTFGLQGVPVDRSGELAYFGLAATNSTDDQDAIAFFNAEREPFLEYDLTRLIYNLANPEKRVIGVISSLSIHGDPARRIPPMAIVNLMNQLFRVRTLTTEVAKIDDDVDVLLVIHPRELSEKTLYAIDQFVLRGGGAMVFVDPFAEMGGAGQPQRMPGQTLSRLDRLFDAWGIEFDPEKFAADRTNAMRVSIPATRGGGRDLIVDYLSWLHLGSQNLNQDDVVTSQISRIALASAGFLTRKDGAATEFTPLILTSPESMGMPAKEIRITPNPIGVIEKFVSEDQPLVLAARVQGKVGSAFAEGPPANEEEAAEQAAKKDGAGAAAEHLTTSTDSIRVVVVADTDILADQMWFQQQDFFGQRVMVPTANNADFVINVVDNLIGSNALVDLRGRGLSVRPFERINAIQRQAELRYRKTEQELREKLDDTQRKLGELQTDQSGEGAVILTENQRATLDGFRAEMVSVRRQLREVQHALRRDIEELNTRLKVLNIWVVPMVISVIALIMAIIRRWRHRRHAASA